CAKLSIMPEFRDDHVQYVASWLKILKEEDKKAISTAAAAASRSMGRGRPSPKSFSRRGLKAWRRGIRSPFGIKVPPKGAHDLGQSSAAAKNGSCNDSDFRGVSVLPSNELSPALPGHRPASQAGSLFLGLVAPCIEPGAIR